MHCRGISVINFKNLEELSLEFSPKFNCFAGHNGAGKTNLLDAIYYLSFCKSFSNPMDSQNIRFGKDSFIIQGIYQKNGDTDKLYCGFRRGKRKVFRRNKKEYDRLSDHIGDYPLVLLSPADSQLIMGGSDERRKFIDGVISQYDREYLHRLIAYNKALQQRNALLKIFAEKNTFDPASLEAWDESLIVSGQYLFEQRKSFFDAFLPVFQKHYAFLSESRELTGIAYESSLQEGDFRGQLIASRQKDRILQHTSRGIHKDDLDFLIHGVAVKKFGSQGQQKTLLIALKLAQFVFTRDIKGTRPFLLFDDVFDKLDTQRVTRLMQLVSREDFGQVFVSDTHADRLEALFREIGSECRIFVMEEGNIRVSKLLASHSNNSTHETSQ